MPSDPNPDLAARRVALALMQAGLDRRGGFDEAMTRPPFTDLTPRERAWARGLAATAFRRLGSIDAALAARLQRPPPPPVTMATLEESLPWDIAVGGWWEDGLGWVVDG